MSASHRGAFIASIFLLAPFCPGAYGQETSKDAPVVLERFKVGRDGEPLLVPVTLNGKTYQFLLDTGASFTVYDNSLPLGIARRKTKVDSAGGPVEIQFFDAPDAKIGNMKLHTGEEIVGFDHAKLRGISGHEIYGVVGMDFLAKHIVEIDCDEGEVRFLRAMRRDAGTRFRLEFEGGRPCVDASVQGLGKMRFMVDTGFMGNASAALELELLANLERNGAVRVVGQTLAETFAGTKSSRVAKGKKLSLGEFAVANPVIHECPLNLLGLGFLSRFKVRFDFPNGAMYLQKGKRFDTPDLWDVSGLHIVRKKGKTIVDSVDKGSAAANRGIKAGDAIAKVSDRNIDALTLFEFRRLCSQPDTTLTLTIEREGTLYTAAVNLKQ